MGLHVEAYTPKSPAEVDLARIVFIAGFARGGTTWTRRLCALHPEIDEIQTEVVFRANERPTRTEIKRRLFDAMKADSFCGSRLVMKAPANALAFPMLHRLLPESKFIFITRDPRDVFNSFKQSEIAWMGGRNKEIAFCLGKQMKHSTSFDEIEWQPNALRIYYEKLHQDFGSEFRRVCAFLGVDGSARTVEAVMSGAAFSSMTGRDHTQENKMAGARRGVVGEWAQFFTEAETAWIMSDPFWRGFMGRHGYGWDVVSTRRIVEAVAFGAQPAPSVYIRLDGNLHPRHARPLREQLECLDDNAMRFGVVLTDEAYRSLASPELSDVRECLAGRGPYFHAGRGDGRGAAAAEIRVLDSLNAALDTAPPLTDEAALRALWEETPFVRVGAGLLTLGGLECGAVHGADDVARRLAAPGACLFLDGATDLDLPCCFAFRTR